jgi:hypothetical protein
MFNSFKILIFKRKSPLSSFKRKDRKHYVSVGNVFWPRTGTPIFLLLFFPGVLFSSTLFAPDSDTAILFQLASTTASQLHELEKLVTDAQKNTERLQEYNELAQDHYFRAEKTVALLDEMKGLSDIDEVSLDKLNSKIGSLKDQMASLNATISEYNTRENKNEKIEMITAANENQINKEASLANLQIRRSEDSGTLKGAARLSAQNTALSNKNLVDIKKQNNLILNKLAEQNMLLLKKEQSELRAKKYLLGNNGK